MALKSLLVSRQMVFDHLPAFVWYTCIYQRSGTGGGQALKKAIFTGYKSYELGIYKDHDPKVKFIKLAIRKRLKAMCGEGLDWVLLSGQMGVEMWTAQTVFDLQEEGYMIQLGVIPPFENQESRWPDPVKLAYEEICARADFFQPLYKGEYKGPYQFTARDKWLIDKTDGCVILMDEEYPGNLKYFYKEARQAAEKRNYEIQLITPYDLEEVVQEQEMQDPGFWE